MKARQTTSSDGVCSLEIVEWRRHQLVAAGFAAALAAELAESRDIDLHAALQLVDQGCLPQLAARILAPLNTPNSGGVRDD
jgi:hypothetical protein